jgi:hypothetical protein
MVIVKILIYGHGGEDGGNLLVGPGGSRGGTSRQLTSVKVKICDILEEFLGLDILLGLDAGEENDGEQENEEALDTLHLEVTAWAVYIRRSALIMIYWKCLFRVSSNTPCYD